jgi:hypothetical protein
LERNSDGLMAGGENVYSFIIRILQIAINTGKVGRDDY